MNILIFILIIFLILHKNLNLDYFQIFLENLIKTS